MNTASSPATPNQKYELTRYMIPIFLWSVVVSQSAIGWRRGLMPCAASASASGLACVIAILMRSLPGPNLELALHGAGVGVAVEEVAPRLQGRQLVGGLLGAGEQRCLGVGEDARRAGVVALEEGHVVGHPLLVVEGDLEGAVARAGEAVLVEGHVLGRDRSRAGVVGAAAGRLLLGLLQPGLELGPADGPDGEAHRLVGQAAVLGALAAVVARLGDGQVEGVDVVGEGVALEEELAHIERVDDVLGLGGEADRVPAT